MEVNGRDHAVVLWTEAIRNGCWSENYEWMPLEGINLRGKLAECTFNALDGTLESGKKDEINGKTE